MMRIVPFKPEHLFAIQPQAAQSIEVGWMTPDIAEAAATHTSVSAFDDDGEIIGCAGMAPIEEEIVAWAVFSERVAEHGIAVTRACRRMVSLFSGQRVISHARPDHPKAARFLKALGFRFEREDRNILPSGEVFHVYVVA